jgi:NarL family two-component system sensor histidine kinase LiaS
MARQLRDLLVERQERSALSERNRLARELHDSVKQQTFAVSAQLRASRLRLESDPAAAETHLREAERLVDRVREELAALIHELHPPELETQDVVAALREYISNWTQRSHIPAEMELRGSHILSPDVQGAMLRIVQEALANVARHSGASSVRLELDRDAGGATLSILDDGQGFDVDGEQRGLGLRSMRERAELAGGVLSVESTVGAGTHVVARFPEGRSA